MASTTDTNLAAQTHLGELLAEGKIDQLHEVFHPDVVDHDPMPGQSAGADGIKEFWTMFTTAFPDLEATPVVVSADDQYVTVVMDLAGTHSGDFQGHAGTGKKFSIRGIQVGRFEDGMLVERWGSSDEAGLLKQLGLA